jgi:scavenger receptor class B, member 1
LLFKVWRKLPIDVFVNVYLFNITNAKEFLSGEHKKLQFSEIGPYSYQEFIEHKNSVFNDNGTITYEIVRSLVPVKKESAADPFLDIVFTPNIVLLGASTVAAKHSKVAAYGFTALAKGLDAQPIVNMTVQKLLWGYDDKMIKLAAQFMPSLLPTKKFGFLERVSLEFQFLFSVWVHSADLFNIIIDSNTFRNICS